jgi:GNAT superfamily N-acetyltransferase
MTLADLPAAMRLKSQAGWNQVEADWRRFLEMQPDGCFVAELDGAAGGPVGTTVTCIFADVAWIAMVLVDADLRRQGIGTALLHHALEFVDRRGVASVRLDATPLGKPLYEKLGFATEYTLSRYAGDSAALASRTGCEQDCVKRPTQPGELERLIALDRGVTGTHRRKYLERLFVDNAEGIRIFEGAAGIEGYLMVRPGSDALQVGPCVGTLQACVALLDETAARHAGQSVFLDVPTRNLAAVHFAEIQDLKVQRTLVRMCRGRPVKEDDRRLFASSGPELG